MNAYLKSVCRRCLLGFLGFSIVATASADISLFLPQQRTAYQCNETFFVAVRRAATVAKLDPVDFGPLRFEILGNDASRLVSELSSTRTRAVEHFLVNGRALRPGTYDLVASQGTESARTTITVHSHIRRSSFKLIYWGRSQGKEQLAVGDEGLGFNVFYGHYADNTSANFIRAGMDFIFACAMGGGHQMDLRRECDWSDPNVVFGGTQRAARRAFKDRTRPNVLGIHFYDEPGLTWLPHPKTKKDIPHNIPAQDRAYRYAFGEEPIQYCDVSPEDPEHVAAWRHLARWKLGLLDAAWRDAAAAVTHIEPKFLSITQSQYGHLAFTDGYYYNVTRSLPVVSGHGGYHDWGPGYFNPVMTMEFARARDLERPCWYLPTWFGATPADAYRVQQYLCFQTHIQGMVCPPDIKVPGTLAAPAVVETNRVMSRLGPIFTTMPVRRQPVAVLHSLSHNIHAQTQDMSMLYSHGGKHGHNAGFAYMAGKLMQHQFMPVMDEDVRDGSLDTFHRVILLTSIDHLDDAVRRGLSDFAANGGLVLVTPDCAVKVDGATVLDVEVPPFKGNVSLPVYLDVSSKWAAALAPHFARIGLSPIMESTAPGIVATEHGNDDVRYYFAVNATFDSQQHPLIGLGATAAQLALPGGGALYDAVHGGRAKRFTDDGKQWRADVRFGPGQMKVWAKTARPIAAVDLLPPRVRLQRGHDSFPATLTLVASVEDSERQTVGGSIPMRVIVTDPTGAVRYDLFRATDDGGLRLELPLAANEPVGQWTVTVTELLGMHTAQRQFQLSGKSPLSAVVSERRAVTWHGERDRVARFFRNHHDVTILVGSSGFNIDAANRLRDALATMDVRCAIKPAGEVVARRLTAEDAKTWVGMEYAPSGHIREGQGNSPDFVGFDVSGAVILMGNAVDNPIISFLQRKGFLPFAFAPGVFPGPQRGAVTWQSNAVGRRLESVALIADDAVGMAEAVGSLFEAASELERPLQFELLAIRTGQAASPKTPVSQAGTLWELQLPDTVAAIWQDGDVLSLRSVDGSISQVDRSGQVIAQRPATAAEQSRESISLPVAKFQDEQLRTDATLKTAVSHGRWQVAVYWGGRVQLINPESGDRLDQHLGQDVVGVASFESALIVALANGRVRALSTDRPLRPTIGVLKNEND